MQVHNHNACAFVYPKRTPGAYSTNMLRAQRAGRAIFQWFCADRGDSIILAHPTTVRAFIEPGDRVGRLTCERVEDHCYREGALLRSYELRSGETLNEAAIGQPTRKDLEDQAKTNLINERLAFSPYAQISFKSEYLW